MKRLDIFFRSNLRLLIALIGIFCVLLAIKLFMYNHNSFFFFTWDELTYLSNAKIFLSGSFLHDDLINGHYPPLYPILLAPAFLFPEDYFHVGIILNSFYSCLSFFFTYLLARKYLNRQYSFLCSLLAALLPYQLILNRKILAENIFIPLLLATIYFALKEETETKNTVILGMLLACLWLTRYISLVVIPIIVMIWISAQLTHSNLYTLKRQLLCLLLVILSIYSLWILYGVIHGFPLRGYLGFHITESPNSLQLTIPRLIYWIIRVTASAILIIGPLFFPIIVALEKYRPSFLRTKIDIEKIKTINKSLLPQNRLFIALVGISMAFLFATIRHFWRVDYNYPDITKFFTRYLVFLTPIFIVVFVIGLREAASFSLRAKFRFTVVNAVFIWFSYLLLFQVPIFNLPPIDLQILREAASLDVTIYQTRWGYLYLLIITLLPIISFLPDQIFRWVYTIIVVMIFVFELIYNYSELARFQTGYFAMKQVDSYLEIEDSEYLSNIILFYDEKDKFISNVIYYNGDKAFQIYWTLLGNESNIHLVFDVGLLCPVQSGEKGFIFAEKEYALGTTSRPIVSSHYMGTDYILSEVTCR